MASSNEIKVTLSADASKLTSALKQAGVELKTFGGEAKTAAPQTEGFVTQLGDLQGAAAALGLTAAAATLAQFGKESFLAAAQAERLGRATQNMAQAIGSSGSEMVAAITGASQGTISQVDAMQAANKAMMFGLVENSSQMEELTRIAITLGAAMGQDATKSFDDLTTALGRQSPLILDNLGITLRLEEAHRIYADSLGKTVEQLTEEEKKQAFVSAALEIGRQKVEELGGVTIDSATKVEQMSTAWDNFKVAVGGALTEANNKAGVLDFITNGLQGWTFAIQEGIPAIKAHNAEVVNASTKAILAAQSHEELAAAMSGGVNDFTVLRGALINSSKGYDEYITKVDEMIQIGVENLGWTDQQVAALIASKAEYEATKTAVATETAALQTQSTILAQNTQAMRLAGEAAYYQAEAQTAAAQAAIAANGATNAGKNAQSDRWAGLAGADEMAQARTAGLTSLDVQQQAEFIVDFEKSKKAAEAAAEDTKKAFRKAADDTEDAYQGAFNTVQSAVENQLTPTLNDVWKPPEGGDTFDEDAKRLATVSTDGFASEWLNQLNTQYAGMDWWAPITEAMQSGDSSKLQAAATDILNNNVTALWDVEKIKEGVRKQLQEQNAKQQIMDTIMAELTAEGVVGAQAAAEGASSAANAGLLGQMMGDPATVATGITTGLAPAIDDLKGRLAGLNGEAAAAGEEGAAAAGGPFGALQTGAAGLDTYLNTTLATSVTTLQTTLTTAAADGVVQIGTMTTAATTLNTELTTVKDTGQTTGTTIVTGMTNGANAITTKLIPAINRATQAFEKMATAARDAARAAGSAGSNAGDAGWGGGRASGGSVSSSNLYLVGERGPELFIPGSNGYIAPFRESAPVALGAAGGGGGGSLSIGTIVLQGVQDARALFDGIEREARNRGYKFQAVS